MEYMGQPPFIKTPLSHLRHVFGGPTLQNTTKKQCLKFESNYYNCLEAYGYDKGIVACRDIFEDMMECRYGYKESYRINKITEQRKKLYREGKIKTWYTELPTIDSFYPPYM